MKSGDVAGELSGEVYRARKHFTVGGDEKNIIEGETFHDDSVGDEIREHIDVVFVFCAKLPNSPELTNRLLSFIFISFFLQHYLTIFVGSGGGVGGDWTWGDGCADNLVKMCGRVFGKRIMLIY